MTGIRSERQIMERLDTDLLFHWFVRLGVDDAVPETIEAALQLSEAVLVDVGVPMGLVIASVHERRDEFRAILRKADGTGPRATEFRSRRTVGKAS